MRRNFPASQVSCPPSTPGLRAVAALSVERLQGSASGPCWGIGDGPQQADFTGFRRGENRENRKVCTALPCLPQLKTTKWVVHLLPTKRI